MYRPKMGIGKGGSEVKIILFTKPLQDYGNRSDDIYLVMQAVGKDGHSHSISILRSLWLNYTRTATGSHSRRIKDTS